MTEIDDNAFAIARLHIDNDPAVIGDFFAGGSFESDLKADGSHRSPVIGVEQDGIETVGLRFLRGGDDYRGLKVNARGESDLLAAEERAAQQFHHERWKSGCYDAHAPNLSHLICAI